MSDSSDAAQRLKQRLAVALEPLDLAGHLVAHPQCRVGFLFRLLRETLDMGDCFLDAFRFLQPLTQPIDLHVHRPHHLIQTIGLDDGTVECLLLSLERVGLLRDVLGECIELRESVFGGRGELMDAKQRFQFLLGVDHRSGRGSSVLPGGQ